MSVFSLFRAKPQDGELKQKLVQLVMDRLTERDNRIRAEDAICGAATIVAERCIDLAGDYSLRDHRLHPGQRVFSARINELLCGDTTHNDQLPAKSVFGQLKAAVNPRAFKSEHFPELGTVFYAAGVGEANAWGKVPLTVPAHHLPEILPLRFGFETRGPVDSIFEPVADDKARCLRVTVLALADLLNQVASVIAPSVALRLAFETINGMAKTAPMTEQAVLAAQLSAKSPAAPGGKAQLSSLSRHSERSEESSRETTQVRRRGWLGRFGYPSLRSARQSA